MRFLVKLVLVYVLFTLSLLSVLAQDNAESLEDYYVEAFVTNPIPYVGEQIEYVFRFHVHQIPENLSEELPDFEGFWVLDIAPPDELDIELRAGRQYFVGEYRVTLSPIRAEVIIIDPAALLIPKTVFQDEAIVPTSRVATAIQPLPPSAPYGFTGAVGSFHAEINLDRTLLILGEPLTLTMALTGAGNLESLVAPDWQFPVGWRIYTSPTRYMTRNVSGLRVGEKIFTWQIVPENTGSLTFPELQFVYFDPIAADYQIITEPSITIDVLPGESGMRQLPAYGVTDSGQAGFLAPKPIPSSVRMDSSEITMGFWLLWIVFPLITMVCAVWVMGRYYQSHRRLQFRQSNAFERAKKRLRLVYRSPPTKASKQITMAVYGYIADRRGHSAKRLKPPMIPAILEKHTSEQAVTQAVIDCLNQAEAMRYIPKGATLDIAAITQETIDALRQLDTVWIVL